MKFSNLTYKQKMRFLIIGSALFLILCYQLAISKTLAEFTKYRTLQQNAGDTQDMIPISRNFKSEEETIKRIQSSYIMDSSGSDGRFLVTLDLYCKTYDLQLKEYKPSAISSLTGQQTVWTRSVLLTGGFVNLLTLVYMFEQKETHYRIASVAFNTQMDNSTKKPYLTCTVYVQNLLNQGDDAKPMF